MKQTPSPVKRLWELAGAHRRAYALSIILAILGVACGMIPYFAIAYIMLCLIDGVTALNTYAVWCGVILLGFTLKLLFSTLSTTVSHTSCHSLSLHAPSTSKHNTSLQNVHYALLFYAEYSQELPLKAIILDLPLLSCSDKY